MSTTNATPGWSAPLRSAPPHRAPLTKPDLAAGAAALENIHVTGAEGCCWVI